MPGIILLTHWPTEERVGVNVERIDSVRDVLDYNDYKDWWGAPEPTEAVRAGIATRGGDNFWVEENEDDVDEIWEKLEDILSAGHKDKEPGPIILSLTAADSGKAVKTPLDSIELVLAPETWDNMRPPDENRPAAANAAVLPTKGGHFWVQEYPWDCAAQVIELYGGEVPDESEWPDV